MTLKMLCNWRQYKTGEIINPPVMLANWLLKNCYAEPVKNG